MRKKKALMLDQEFKLMHTNGTLCGSYCDLTQSAATQSLFET